METIVIGRSIEHQLFLFMSDLFHDYCLCSIDHGDATIDIAHCIIFLFSNKLAKNQVLQQGVNIQIITELFNVVFG